MYVHALLQHVVCCSYSVRLGTVATTVFVCMHDVVTVETDYLEIIIHTVIIKFWVTEIDTSLVRWRYTEVIFIRNPSKCFITCPSRLEAVGIRVKKKK
jgi:hypothetical protein